MIKNKPNEVVYHVLSHHIDHYIHFRKIITGGLTLTSGVIPTLKLEFDVSRAVQGNSSTYTNAVMNAAEPVMTLSFQ